MQKALRFMGTTIGKKVVMAVTGLILFGFVIGHMVGNLQVFLGPEIYNAYAVGMHGLGPLLWVARSVLLVAVVLHIVMAVQLVTRSAAARPVGYRVKQDTATTFAAKTMKFSGFLLLFFILFHLAHFTFPGLALGAYEAQPYTAVYSNFKNAFSIPWVVALYVAAQVTLGLHIYHGSWSLLQTLGLNNPLRNAALTGTARFIALVVTVGNIILPFGVLLGLVG
jgi:succinate dehydrogenase / fumarate reductase, cytochrome b subunit